MDSNQKGEERKKLITNSSFQSNGWQMYLINQYKKVQTDFITIELVRIEAEHALAHTQAKKKSSAQFFRSY